MRFKGQHAYGWHIIAAACFGICAIGYFLMGGRELLAAVQGAAAVCQAVLAVFRYRALQEETGT